MYNTGTSKCMLGKKILLFTCVIQNHHVWYKQRIVSHVNIQIVSTTAFQWLANTILSLSLFQMQCSGNRKSNFNICPQMASHWHQQLPIDGYIMKT